MSWSSFNTIVLGCLIAAVLGWLGPAIDDNSAEHAQAEDLQVALQQASERNRFAAAAQALCGPQSNWEELADGSVQCRTRFGKPTITVKVSP